MATLVAMPRMRLKFSSFPPFLGQSYRGPRTFSLFNKTRTFTVSASSSSSTQDQVRVRFAPSPTGNLHVGGARTALFNYLFARSNGGKFVMRIEDTDLERSTKESEEAVLQDLSWLGLDWDEGPGVDGDYGPYRQSERNSMYKQYAEKLLESGTVYRCFCSSEELEEMKEIAKRKQLPPVYTGKWASATDKDVQEELEKGTPYTYRFRVPKEGSLKINDLIRGEVSWNLDTLGDFVIMRSNGQPVYNFCVTVDDATMAISHVIRAEEHLPNTLRQALIYKALGFAMPHFAHVSLILAPDRSKLSKRHGATSVGQFREMGYLPQAMVNYLALLGWGDGTDNEFFTLKQLEKFTIGRVNKSGAIFDNTKLRWMNGQHLQALPSEELKKRIGEQWKSTGILTESDGSFVEDAFELLKDGIYLVPEADKGLSDLLSYPLHATLTSPEAKPLLEDNLSEFAANFIAAYDNGELIAALEEGHAGWKNWVKSFGKSIKRKGKSLFMPLRVLITGKFHGPDMGASVLLLHKAAKDGVVSPQAGFVTLDERFNSLRQVDWEALSKDQPLLETASTV
ncbi:glutamate--tRNA ligase, chloroplastic/mitochondrial isoform X2 [Argentina anserina]|uniref:glutamate--tRNA ligase, chloroplastic/mitochondrial isoform X2 n=1 Tax=Argentina anserina TaxID=57926 RepID=UPI0021768326|nr:glutamate--tRNA ligase, chloroplastic/mitochondrial isoform X2 [Potentilla anserina]